MKTVAIVQARATSTRLPNKVLLPLAGISVLGHVLRRVAATRGIDAVCCAVPEGSAHDAVAAEATRFGAAIFRGNENDVLARFAGAARALNAEVVMRVTSDCPLADPDICAQVIALRVARNADYACNNMPPSWPHGLDCEVFTTEALYRAERDATDPFQREHVTPWIRTCSGLARANLDGPGGEVSENRWTLDFPEDFQFFERLFALLPAYPALPRMEDVLAVLQCNTEIATINSRHFGVSRPEGGR
jgi:spore coat polysaccharide biosynthesis protein SpsF